MQHVSELAKLRACMERCSQIVTDAYSHPPEQLSSFQGELPPQHPHASHRRHRYWVHEQGGDLVVALPGTTHPLDWSSNMRVHYVPIDGSEPAPGAAAAELEQMPCAHAGFYYRADTIPTLALLEQAAAKGLRLVLTGHSLGGAVANVCALTALRAQQKARDAAADAAAQRAAAATAAAAAAAAAAGVEPVACQDSNQQHRQEQQAHAGSSSPQRVSPFEAAAGASATAAAQAHTNHSWCSANSDILVSPQAALVEVLCISFASPHWANSKLVGMLEARGWDECFVNVVVPEDYCLKLFNNVLTSAPPSEHNMSPSSSSGGGGSSRSGSSRAQPDDSLDSLEFEEVPDAAAGASGDGEAAASPTAETAGADEEAPRFTYTPNSQQPMASAMAGTRGLRQKKQLSFAMPQREAAAGEEEADEAANAAAADPAAAAAEEAALLRVLAPPAITVPAEADIAAADVGSWGDVRAALPMSPSTASLSSLSSWNSNRSWTLLAYLPDMVLRSFGSSSSSNSSGGGSSINSSGGGGGSSSTPAAAPAAPAGSSKGWNMRHAKSSINLHTPPAEADSSSLSSSSSCDSLDCLAGMGADQLEAQRGGAPVQQQGQQQAPASQRRSLRRSVSSASMKIFEKTHVKLLQPLSSTLKLGSSSLALLSALLPSIRSLALARRALAATASSIADRAFNVPLTVLEVGLIKALRPPMYQPAGQQWILSATGLVPQHQPIHLYPKHIHDVFWHKELAMVAFREHSIVFYKARLGLQAARR